MLIAAIVLGVVVLILLVGSFIAYRMTFYATQKKKDMSRSIPPYPQVEPYRVRLAEMLERIDTHPYETVELRTKDGKRLMGRYYHTADGAPLDIGFHGYKSHPNRDFCGGLYIGLENRHNVLLVEQRSHVGSDGVTIRFGIRERQDCLAWIEYALDRFGKDTEILLYGVSMGAATVLMACGLSLPENVKGVIADCPYSSPRDIIRKVCQQDMGLPAGLLMPLVDLGALLFGHFRLDRRITAANAVKGAGCPILIIHGDDDRFVPHTMSQEIYAANPDRVRYALFPRAGHAMSYMEDTPRYIAEVERFMHENCGVR